MPSAQQPPRVPRDLQSVRPEVLEQYVQERLLQYADILVNSLRVFIPEATVSNDQLQRTARDALTNLPAADYSPAMVENMELQLVFRHDCLALGCLDPQCVMCQHNPQRRCNVNFDRKYLVNDLLKAKCGAIIRVELIDRNSGVVIEDDLPDIQLEMNVLDGNLYESKFTEIPHRYADNGPEQERELTACSLLINNRQLPLLVCSSNGNNDSTGKAILQLQRGKVPLPDLHITDSSEAMLSGRKPPFRLLVRAVHKEGRAINIRYAVSEGFVVATRRTRTAGKVEIPSVDDPVSKLEHMGKETVKKLQDLKTAATQAGVEIDIPESSVHKVGEFKQLAMRAEQDGHLRQKLQHVLKLSKEKWEEARDHAMRAVVADNRMRAWYADRRSMDVGLLFTCRLGGIDLERPVALLQRTTLPDGQQKVDAILMAQQTSDQRDIVRRMQPEAVHQWWVVGHPGWSIFPTDSEQFLQSGMLVVQPDPLANLPPGSPVPILPTPEADPQPNHAPSPNHNASPFAIHGAPIDFPRPDNLPAFPLPANLPVSAAAISPLMAAGPSTLPQHIPGGQPAATGIAASGPSGTGTMDPNRVGVQNLAPQLLLIHPPAVSQPSDLPSLPGTLMGTVDLNGISLPSGLLVSQLPSALGQQTSTDLDGVNMDVEHTNGQPFGSLSLFSANGSLRLGSIGSLELPDSLTLAQIGIAQSSAGGESTEGQAGGHAAAGGGGQGEGAARADGEAARAQAEGQAGGAAAEPAVLKPEPA